MAGYSVELSSDFTKMTEKLKNFPVVLKEVTKTILTSSALIAEGKAKESAPHQKGTLQNSISHKIFDDYAIVGTNVEYAQWQEFGTGIYGPRGTPIVPRRARALMITDRGGNVVAWAKSVRGVQPKLFMKKGYEEMKSKINYTLTLARDVAIKGMMK